MKIILGDLRHSTIGNHSACMPLAVNLIASYTESFLGKDNISIDIYHDGHEIISAVEKEPLAILALSNYCWNCELGQLVFRSAKKASPHVVCIAGGPEFPRDTEEGGVYLRNRNEIDFYVYQEGEAAFANLTKNILKTPDWQNLKTVPLGGIKCIDPTSQKLITGAPLPRLENLDVIPSPYLSGRMDKYFNGKFEPFIESARGCPYACTFCEAASDWYNKVNSFSIERIKNDLNYIALRVHEYPDLPLAIADSNFGMLKRDEDIAEHISTLQKEYGWPNYFNVSTGKAQHERIIRVAKKLNKKLVISLSVQSLNSDTLRDIKRKNLGDSSFEQLYQSLREIGINTYSDLILPLPLETKESFLDGLRQLSRAKVDRFIPFTTMMLKGTEFASKENRMKHGMVTKFRVLPKQFGIYNNHAVFEVEEVCVATNTMSFQEYCECRGIAFIIKVYSESQFDIVQRLLNEFKLDRYEFNYTAWQKIKSSDRSISDVYNTFLDETRNELFDTKEEVQEYYSMPENYQALLQGHEGDNVMRKHYGSTLIDYNVEAIELAFEVVTELVQSKRIHSVEDIIKNAKRWMLATRNIGDVFHTKKSAFKTKTLNFDYDVQSWYNQRRAEVAVAKEHLLATAAGIGPGTLTGGIGGDDFGDYQEECTYEITYDRHKIQPVIDLNKRLYSKNIYHWVPKAIENSSLQFFWSDCKRIQ